MSEENAIVKTDDRFSGDALKKLTWKGYFACIFFSMRMFTFERMMGPDMVSFVIAMADDLYPNDPEKQRELAMNHRVFFNTQPTLGTIVWGVVLGLEIERSQNEEMTDEIIQNIKAAIAAPMAGIGDTVAQSLLVPILLSIGIGLSSEGSTMGFWFFIIVYCVIMYPLSYFLFKIGLTLGIDGAEMLLSSGLKDRIINAIQTLGIVVIGAVIASTANVTTKLEYVNGEMAVNVQEILDSIFPGLLSLLGAFLVYGIFKKFKIKPITMMLGMLAVAVVAYFTGIF